MCLDSSPSAIHAHCMYYMKGRLGAAVVEASARRMEGSRHIFKRISADKLEKGHTCIFLFLQII